MPRFSFLIHFLMLLTVHIFLLASPDLYLTSILQEVDRVPATVYGSKTATTNEQMECLQHALTCKLSMNHNVILIIMHDQARLPPL